MRLGHPSLYEPLNSTEAERPNIFRNSLADFGEEDWSCPVCAFENRPRVKTCSLCGTSREFAMEYEAKNRNRMREKQDWDLRVDTANAINSGGEGDETGKTEVPLSPAERRESFNIRRINQLTLRQRCARRRRLWQRRMGPDGKC